MFEFMKIKTLRAVYTAMEDGTLPAYMGSTIRGVMGHCFREFVCHYPVKKCFSCQKRYQCSYVRYFSNTGKGESAINPFALYVHTKGKKEWKKGEECIFDLKLFGDAAEHSEIYMNVLLQMGKKGWGASRLSFCLRSVTDPDKGVFIYGGGQTFYNNLRPYLLELRKGNANFAFVTFDAPVRIVSGKELFTTLPFSMLMKFLVGRFSLVTKVCTDFSLEWDQEEMQRRAAGIRIVAEEWRTINFVRYSMNAENNKLELPGKMGWVLYEGDLSDFYPYLELGKYLQVGKNTTIGFGHYDVFYDEEDYDEYGRI